jgi:hypothetical protein
MSSRAQRTHPLLLLHPAASPAISPAVGARHLAVDRPSQAPSGQIDPTTVIPYPPPVPCHHSTVTGPRPRQRITADFTGGRAQPVRPPPPPPSPPPSAINLPLPLARGPASFPRSRAKWATCPRGRARPRSARPKSPPAQLAEEISFLFPFIFLYICIYIDILCTKNSLNKF